MTLLNLHMEQPQRYAVIGSPVAHSKSPEIHAFFAAQTGQKIRYERLLAPLDGFAECVSSFLSQGGRGANVTLPFKTEACRLATKLTERARAAGAVNTLKFDDSGIVGDNTDGVGLVADILRITGIGLRGKKLLLLGAGGAARGVVLPLLQQQPQQLVVANRTCAKAQELQSRFAGQGPLVARAYAALQEQFDIVINATSASLTDDLPPIAGSLFAPGALAYDMMYGKEPTVFMRFAGSSGARAYDGLGMLVEQAAEAFFVWHGVRPETGPVLELLRRNL